MTIISIRILVCDVICKITKYLNEHNAYMLFNLAKSLFSVVQIPCYIQKSNGHRFEIISLFK